MALGDGGNTVAFVVVAHDKRPRKTKCSCGEWGISSPAVITLSAARSFYTVARCPVDIYSVSWVICIFVVCRIRQVDCVFFTQQIQVHQVDLKTVIFEHIFIT